MKRLLLGTSIFSVALGSLAAEAQDTDAPDTDAGDAEWAMSQIVVTARFREESAQDIGQSIRAFGQQEIEGAGILDFSDIARRTPGLDFNDRGPNANEVSIRGISKLVSQSTLDILPSQTVVTQFVDDIPTTSPNSRQRDFHLFDFNRVEILRGPQPTYFGEGSVGGTIRYFSADPSLEAGLSGKFSAGLSHTSGGDLNYEVNGSVDVTLVEGRLGIRATGFRRDDAGFIDNTRLGVEDVNFFDTTGGRFVLLARPVDDLTIRFAAHITNDTIGDDWIADDDSTNFTASFNPFLNNTQDDVRLYSLNATYDFGPVTATSITGWYKRDVVREVYDLVQSLNSIPVLFGFSGDVFTTNFVNDDNFTQELRLVSNFDGWINFTSGFFYKDSDTAQTAGAVSQEIAAIDIMGRDLFFGTTDEVSGGTRREQTSAFLELTVQPVDKLRLIGGFRWLNETLTSPTGVGPGVGDVPTLASCILTPAGIPNVPNPGDNAVVFGVNPCIASTLLTTNQLFAAIPGASDLTEVVNEVDDKFLPKFAIEYAPTDTILVYGSVSQGIRNGGINSSFVVVFAPEVPLEASSLTFGPDELWAYEIGFKSVWDDGNVIFNAAFYYNDWDDIQVQQSTSAGELFINAPSARSLGIELETTARLNDHVSAFLAGNYTSAQFTQDLVLATPESAFVQELLGRPVSMIADGNRLPNVPKFTFSLGLDFRVPVSIANTALTVVGRGDYQFTGERFSDIANTPENALESFGIANLRVGLEGGNWSVTAFVTNLANTVANQSFFQVGPQQLTPNFVNRPRTAGLTLRGDF